MFSGRSFSSVGVKRPAPESPYTAAVDANTSGAPSMMAKSRTSLVNWKLLSIMYTPSSSSVFEQAPWCNTASIAPTPSACSAMARRNSRLSR